MNRELFKGALYALEINAALGLLDKTKDIEADLMAEYDRLTALIAQMLTELKQTEWVVDDDGSVFCPSCGTLTKLKREHYPKCTREAAIRAAEGGSDE